MKSCRDFQGNCCGSCHWDADAGYDLCEVYAPDGSLFAMVCCIQADAAHKALEKS